MEEKKAFNKDNCDLLLADIKTILEMLNPLIGSYRILVGAAEEFNRIALAHKSDLEAAIKRADDLGDIIDDINKKLKPLVKEYLKRTDCNGAISAISSDDLMKIIDHKD